jgi:16S rRNA processing protein RimM
MRTHRVGIFHLHAMKTEDCFKIGYVMKPHGLKGQVTVSVQPEFPQDEPVTTVYLEDNNRLVPYFINELSMRGDKAFVKFEDIDSPEAAAAISKKSIYLPKTSRPASGRGEFYDDEIIGFEVIDAAHGPIGTVSDVTVAGSNKLLTVVKDEKEVLIPINSPFIKSVNKKKKTVSVELPDGFLDI